MSKPIEEFKTQEELNQYLKWWQDKLFLNDWIIKARIGRPEDFINEDACGENSMIFQNKQAMILILDKQYFPKDNISKYCAEQILCHELLHCRYNWMENRETYEGVYIDEMEHQLLEQMAKSLIMAKYDIGFDYFVGEE